MAEQHKQGDAHHGWSPDVDAQHTEDNPSAHRSFHAEEHAPDKGRGRRPSDAERGQVPGDTVESDHRGGEEHARKGDNGMHGKGGRGRSGRPTGTKDDSAFTGVDPDDGTSGHRPG
ncbi:hypothetical protein ACGFZL_28310 [Streptomyces sp. NPDC048182]|uniref:hypothetical protein n=1 Tax=Streptomyces sp. NPDC048182 TaxID=3365507 RepID=UPI00372361D5